MNRFTYNRLTPFFVKIFFILICTLTTSVFAQNNKKSNSDNVWFAAGAAGIYHGVLMRKNGKISDLAPAVEGISSDYLVQHPKQKVLYSINNEKSGSSVASYNIADNGSLALQSSLSGRPKGGAHINVNPEGNLLAVAFYSGGITGVYSLKPDGSIGKLVKEFQHEGSSTHASRQKEPHPHWTGFSSDGKYLFVTDLGTDHIWVYSVNAAKNKVNLSHKVQVVSGSGPRHMAFHPSSNYVYVTDELTASVTTYAFNPSKGEFKHVETRIAAEEASKEVWSNVSDLRVHPSGDFLYVVTRGFDQVSVFSIDKKTGKLTPVEREPVRGSISRNMAITKDGSRAIVTGSKSNTAAVFSIDQKTGEMQFMYNRIYRVPNARAVVIDGYAN